MQFCMKQLPTTAIPLGFEALGEIHPLTMMLTQPLCWMAPAYDQRYGAYGLILFSDDQAPVFLATIEEIDAIVAMVEWSMDLFSYWPGTEALIEQWRSIWWVAQAALTQQWLRMQDAEPSQQEVRV